MRTRVSAKGQGSERPRHTKKRARQPPRQWHARPGKRPVGTAHPEATRDHDVAGIHLSQEGQFVVRLTTSTNIIYTTVISPEKHDREWSACTREPGAERLQYKDIFISFAAGRANSGSRYAVTCPICKFLRPMSVQENVEILICSKADSHIHIVNGANFNKLAEKCVYVKSHSTRHTHCSLDTWKKSSTHLSLRCQRT